MFPSKTNSSVTLYSNIYIYICPFGENLLGKRISLSSIRKVMKHMTFKFPNKIFLEVGSLDFLILTD